MALIPPRTHPSTTIVYLSSAATCPDNYELDLHSLRDRCVLGQMKKLVLFLLAIILVQSYGIYGAAQADRIIYSCEVELGPLCYKWKENGFTKLVGGDNAEKIEKKLTEAKESFEKDFLDKIMKSGEKKSKWNEFLDTVSDTASEGLDKAKKAADKVLDGMDK